MADILVVATSGLHPEQINDSSHSRYPRVDYIELQKYLAMNLLDYRTYDKTPVGHVLRNLKTRVRSDLYLTMLSLWQSRHHDLVFTLSERAGIPYAGTKRFMPNKKPFITMFTCWSKRQEKVITSLNLFSAMDAIMIHCQSMKHHLISLGAAPEKLFVTHYSVDHKFFSPCTKVKPIPGQIMSIGEIRSRDYPTLFNCVASSPRHLMVMLRHFMAEK